MSAFSVWVEDLLPSFKSAMASRLGGVTKIKGCIACGNSSIVFIRLLKRVSAA